MKTTLNSFENAKRIAQGTGGGVSPAVIEEMQAEISILGSQNKTQAQDITDIKGSLNSINDNLALKQPLSDILTQLVDSQVKHYKINKDINSVSSLRSYLVDATVGDGIEISSIKNAVGGGQAGLMITAASSSTYYAGIFFGYYLDDFVFFTRAGETNTIKIYKFTKTLQS